MSYRPAYERALRLSKLFARITGYSNSDRQTRSVFEVVWYRTAGIPLADKFKV